MKLLSDTLCAAFRPSPTNTGITVSTRPTFAHVAAQLISSAGAVPASQLRILTLVGRDASTTLRRVTLNASHCLVATHISPFAAHRGWLRTTTIAQPQRGPARPRGHRAATSAAHPWTVTIGSRPTGRRSPHQARLARARSGARQADTRAARGAGDARPAW